MALDKNKAVAILMPTQEEVDFFTVALAESGFRRVVAFRTAEEAYEVAVRQLFDVFITRMEMPKMNGIVFVQKIRETGNYGSETHLFVCDKISGDILTLLFELDLPYVLTKPFQKQLAAAKFQHLVKSENEVSGAEQLFRDARSAYFNQIYEMALDVVNKVLVLSPALEKALVLKGDILLKQNDVAGAKQTYETVMQVNSKSLTAVHKLAGILMLENKPKEAAALLNKIADLNPYHIKVLENAGLSCLKAEMYTEAEKHMTTLATADQSNKVASSVVAEVRVHQGNYDDIVTVLSKTHGEKEIIQFLNNAGIKLSKENDVAGALKMYKSAAIQLEGKTPLLYAIYYNMGIAYKKLNDKMNAAVCYRQALKLNPKFDKAKAALTEMDENKTA